MRIKNLPWVLFVFFAIGTGLYPLIYYLVDMHDKGLLSSKPEAIKASQVWHFAFYTHISLGGLALLIGWMQFNQKIRNRYLKVHRIVGKTYLGSVLLSSLTGLFIALYASGGIVSTMGFGTLAILWLGTAIKAYTAILKKDFLSHRSWMIVNYSLTFAAVTLRIWLPIAQFILHIDFVLAYRFISWWCWAPNLIVALLIIRRRKNTPITQAV